MIEVNIKIENWENYQTKSDRSKRWVKIYNSIFDSANVMGLKSAERWIYVALLVLAAKREGDIKMTIDMIAKRIGVRPSKLVKSLQKMNRLVQVTNENGTKVELNSIKNEQILRVKNDPIGNTSQEVPPKTPLDKNKNREEIEESVANATPAAPEESQKEKNKFLKPALELAEFLARGIAHTNPAFQKKFNVEKQRPLCGELLKKVEKWATHIERLLRIDKADEVEARMIIRWLYLGTTSDSLFWRKNILSGETFRDKYQRLIVAAIKDSKPEKTTGGLVI